MYNYVDKDHAAQYNVMLSHVTTPLNGHTGEAMRQ